MNVVVQGIVIAAAVLGGCGAVLAAISYFIGLLDGYWYVPHPIRYIRKRDERKQEKLTAIRKAKLRAYLAAIKDEQAARTKVRRDELRGWDLEYTRLGGQPYRATPDSLTSSQRRAIWGIEAREFTDYVHDIMTVPYRTHTNDHEQHIPIHTDMNNQRLLSELATSAPEY